MPALAGSSQQIYQAPSFGRVRTIVVGAVWQDLVGDSNRDLALIRVPPGSRRVLVRTSGDDLAGFAASEEQEETSWVLDPGIHTYSVNIPRNGPRLFVAVDPTDAEATLPTVRIKVMEAG